MKDEKRETFISLIKCFQSSNGKFSPFGHVKISKLEFFRKKGLEKEYLSLTEEEKSSFESTESFFNLLVKYGFKTKENTILNLYPRCLVCNGETKFQSTLRGYSNTCCKECRNKLREKTCLEIYGETSASKSSIVKEKSKEKLLKIYGVDSTNKLPEVQRKKEETSLKNFGVRYPAQSNIVKTKMKNTSLERYNTPHARQKDIKNFENFNIEFIKENFVDERNRVLKHEIMQYFNISDGTYLKKIAPGLRELGLETKRSKDLCETCFLESLGIEIKRQFKVPDTNFYVDGFDSETNTVYEFLGDFWHGNPEVVDLDSINPKSKKTFRELFDYTFWRLNLIKSLGYSVKYIWEKDWRERGLEGLRTL